MTGSCLEYYAICASDWQQDGCIWNVCKTQMCMCLSFFFFFKLEGQDRSTGYTCYVCV